MKKFLTILLVLIVTVALGFTIFYIVRDNEEIYLSTSTLYVSQGDTFDIDINFKNKKSYTSYEVIVDKSSIVQYNESEENFTAVGGGYTKVLFRTSNVNYRNLDCVVYVGDGLSKSTPFYISTAEQLAQIGKVDENGECKYPLNAYYALRDNIVLSDLATTNLGYWEPIGYNPETGESEEFTGYLDGRGYSIINLNLDKNAFNTEVDNNQLQLTKQTYVDAGLFAKLGLNAEVKNIKFENASITGEYNTAGIVAGISNGAKVERIEIKNATLDLNNTLVAGTIVGKMQSQLVNKLYTTATVDRASASVTLLSPSKVFGGLVGENVGGYVIYSYAVGNAELYNNYAENLIYGGIVGKNIVAVNSVDASEVKMGAHVKDCYTSITLSYTIPEDGGNNVNKIVAGMIIGLNKTDETTKDYAGEQTTVYSNKIVGNYYNSDISRIIVGDSTTTYQGVGKYVNYADGNITYSDKEYEVQGKTATELTKVETFKSHIDGNNIILWKFGTVWIETYGQMPILDYSEQAVSPDLYTVSDGITVKTEDEFLDKLENYDQTQPIVIGSDLDFTGRIWNVLGTEENPFNAKIYADYKEDAYGNKVYYRLKNITTSNAYNNNHIDFASLFGYLGKDAELHNVILENASFVNGTHSAGFAYKNEGLIEDCVIMNSTIKGKVSAAGIAIINDGTITKYSNRVIHDSNELSIIGAGVVVNNTNISVSITENNETILTGDVKASGIACVNNGSIKGAVVMGSTSDYAIKVVSTGTSASATLAGIAGENNGSIEDSNISFVKDSDGIRAEGNFYALVGGISAVNRGSINSSYVSANIIASTTNDRVMVAGLVVDLLENGNINTSGYYGNGKRIEGYTAGGIAGILNQSAKRKIGLNGWDAFWGSAKLSTTKEEMGNGVLQCFVSGNTVIKGNRVAGLVVDITNGAVLDSYVGTGVTLTGISGSSQVANFALTVACNARNSENGKFATGIIAYCYSDASFNNPGVSYGVSGDNILETPAGSYDKKSCGFGVSLIVSKSKTSGTKFFDEGWPIYNWFKDGQGNCKTSDSDMYTTNGNDNKFRGFGFATDIWTFDYTQLNSAKSGKVGPTLANAIIDTTLLLVD